MLAVAIGAMLFAMFERKASMPLNALPQHWSAALPFSGKCGC
jgi:hypothetical protein